MVVTATGVLARPGAAVSCLAEMVVAPAPGDPGIGQRARGVSAHADLGEDMAARYQHRGGAGRVPVSQRDLSPLPLLLLPQQYAAPALSSAHVRRAGADLDEGLSASTPPV